MEKTKDQQEGKQEGREKSKSRLVEEKAWGNRGEGIGGKRDGEETGTARRKGRKGEKIRSNNIGKEEWVR